MAPETDLILTEFRKAIRVEAGDYIVLLDLKRTEPRIAERFSDVADMLWKQNIRLYLVGVDDLDAVRFVRVESPETIQVEEK